MRRTRWGKLTIGVLVIGGTFAILWGIYQPRLPGPVEDKANHVAPSLEDAHARLVLRLADSGTVLRATIRCDGERVSATGFWAGDPERACNALAATRGALLAGPGCDDASKSRTGLRVVGAFGSRRFDHRQQFGGCAGIDRWLDVNVLLSPVRVPAQELTDPQSD